MKKIISILAGGSFLVGSAIVAQTIAQTPPNSSAAAPTAKETPDLTRGAQAWADHCSRCHNLRSPSELSADLWDVSVTHMRVRANLPGDLADDIKAFLMFSAESKAADGGSAAAGAPGSAYAYLKPGNVEHGRAVYSQTCIACHGADGKGAIEGIPDFTTADSRLFKPDDILLADVINGFQSKGSLMAMPPKGGNPDLSEQDLADAIAYMRAEFEPKTDGEDGSK